MPPEEAYLLKGDEMLPTLEDLQGRRPLFRKQASILKRKRKALVTNATESMPFWKTCI